VWGSAARAPSSATSFFLASGTTSLRAEYAPTTSRTRHYVLDVSGSSARVVYDPALFDLASRRGRADYSGSSARVVYDLALFGLAF
jgi:hypothetical protein